MLRNAEMLDCDMEKQIRSVTENCEVCIKYKRPTPRPVVSVQMAEKFNEVIAMDLKQVQQYLVLVMVDLATRYCVASVIANKSAKTVVGSVFRNWISLFGAPRKLLSDNGLEFNNSDMRELGDLFGVKILATAAESPWSNGTCERLNAIIGDTVLKVFEDMKCDVDVALAWAVSAHNALANNSGFSPNQLVFGFNPAVPTVTSSSLPALESVSGSDIVRQNLNALHSARREYLKNESSERIKRALRHNVRATEISDLHNGDEVYFKRNGEQRWHGPGTVIGKDGKQVLVRHGGVYIRAHVCRLTKLPLKSQTDSPQDCGGSLAGTQRMSRNVEEVGDQEGLDEESEGFASSVSASCVLPENNTEEVHCDDDGVQEVQQEQSDTVSSSDLPGNPREVNTVKPSVGQRIRGLNTKTGEYMSGRIVSRGGKAKGKYKNWFNFQNDSDGSIECLDFSEVAELEAVPDEMEMFVFYSTEEVIKAKELEVQNWQENDVYEEVEDRGQEFISVRWVITEKVKDGRPLVKARLVARGFEEDTSGFRKDSPACSKESVRLALAMASAFGWECHSLDVKSAYLQGNYMEREVYLRPPPEYYSGQLWKLKKTVYGLCDAARAWYLRVKSQLLSLSAEVCPLEPSLFSWHHDGKLHGIICVYVDDFLWMGTWVFQERVIDVLKGEFCIGSTASSTFKYIGLEVGTTGRGITVGQHSYAGLLAPLKLGCRRSAAKSSELSDNEKKEFRALIGQLSWIATQTRPDIAFDVCELSGHCKDATVGDVVRLNKVISRVVGDNFCLLFEKLSAVEDCIIECFSDASFGNLSDGGSQGGFVIFLKDGEGRRCPVYWQSRKLRRVVKSTLSAETLALVECAEAASYISWIIRDIIKCHNLAVHCLVDNRSLVEALNSSHSVEDRRLRIDIALLKDMLSRGEINSVSWVGTSEQLADCLTKRGASAQRLRAVLSGQ